MRLDLEANIAKTAAKEQALAAIVTQPPPSMNLKPVKLEREFNRQEEFSPPPCTQRHTALNPLVPEWPQARVAVSVPNVPIASERLIDDQSTLQREQNALQIQQNRIVEMLAANQNKSRLPQPRVPTFDGNPLKYHTFVHSLESLIEPRTSISTERLYYLEQYTAVRPCRHLINLSLLHMLTPLSTPRQAQSQVPLPMDVHFGPYHVSLLQFQARVRSLQIFKTSPSPGTHSVLIVQRSLLWMFVVRAPGKSLPGKKILHDRWLS